MLLAIQKQSGNTSGYIFLTLFNHLFIFPTHINGVYKPSTELGLGVLIQHKSNGALCLVRKDYYSIHVFGVPVSHCFRCWDGSVHQRKRLILKIPALKPRGVCRLYPTGTHI